MKILIFGGTTEGRTLARRLKELGHAVTVSVATSVGTEGLEGLDVRSGRLEAGAMTELVRDCDLCVDAAHPYARTARENIRLACDRAGVPLRRISRPESDARDCIVVETARAAAEYLHDKPGNILLTIGAKELPAFQEIDPARLYARVLPTHESISACEALGLPHRNILALWGPFSRALNAAILRQYGIRWLVTKDGGASGGFAEKKQAAEETGTAVLLIRRPEEFGMTLEAFLREFTKGEEK